jgi:NAD(P)-dependent dehydrogenase (short-subunit alcohol dehydrogenase family)
MTQALITGGSAGLGRALAYELGRRGWILTLDARHGDRLSAVGNQLAALTTVRTVVGDVADPDHRRHLVAAATADGPLDLVVLNASELGGSPPPRLRDLDEATAARLWEVNVSAPLQLVRGVWSHLSHRAVVMAISSDAAVEHYEGWGGYGATKAALDHLTLTFAAEEPSVTWYAVDPGDMRTAMHQAAFPGEDIGDRPAPERVAPLVVALATSGAPSGRYRAADLAERLGSPASLGAEPVAGAAQ